MTAFEAMGQAKAIVGMMKLGRISYDKAKSMCDPYLNIVNQKGKEISKKYKKHYYPIVFTNIAR